MITQTIVNISWGIDGLYEEVIFDTIKEAKQCCKEHNLPYAAITVVRTDKDGREHKERFQG